VCCLHNGNDNNYNDDEDGNPDDETHLHVFPPHVLPDPIGIAPEALSGNGKVVCFVLQRVQSLLTLYNFGDIVSHDVDGVVDLCLNGCCLGIRPRASSGSRGIG